MEIVEHKIQYGEPEVLLQTLPKGLQWKIVRKILIVMVPKWPHEDALKFIEWCAKQGIHHRWANGYL